MTLAEEIRQRREARSMTQAELAAATGVARNRISEYESGNRLPSIDTLRALAAELGPFEIGPQKRDQGA